MKQQLITANVVRPCYTVLQVPADHAEVALLGYDGAVPPLDLHALTMTYLGLAFPAPAVSSVSPTPLRKYACVSGLHEKSGNAVSWRSV